MTSKWIRSHRARRAILVVDMVESVRLLQAREFDVIDRWRRFVKEFANEVLVPREGRLVKSLGDGMLLEFRDVRQAIGAAHEAHQRIERFNAKRSIEESIYLRAGVHAAEIVVDESDIYGAGVNLAARLASLANPGQTIASDVVRDSVVVGYDADIEDLGECYVKHVDKPVRAYLLSPAGSTGHSPRLKLPQAQLLRPSIAVLTFAGADGDDLLGKMLADEFAIQASAGGVVDVLSRLSTRRHQGDMDETQTLTFLQHLGAAYGVAGSCLERQGRVYLQVELIHVATNTMLWSKTMQASVDDAIAHPAELVAGFARMPFERWSRTRSSACARTRSRVSSPTRCCSAA